MFPQGGAGDTVTCCASAAYFHTGTVTLSAHLCLVEHFQEIKGPRQAYWARSLAKDGLSVGSDTFGFFGGGIVARRSVRAVWGSMNSSGVSQWALVIKQRPNPCRRG